MGKWLRAGVMEHGELTHPETGVVHGEVSSPVLANLCFYQGLEAWVECEVQPRLGTQLPDPFCRGLCHRL